MFLHENEIPEFIQMQLTLNNLIIDRSLNVWMVAETEIYHKLFYFCPQYSSPISM